LKNDGGSVTGAMATDEEEVLFSAPVPLMCCSSLMYIAIVDGYQEESDESK
jgi:hypothetical protein